MRVAHGLTFSSGSKEFANANEPGSAVMGAGFGDFGLWARFAGSTVGIARFRRFSSSRYETSTFSASSVVNTIQ